MKKLKKIKLGGIQMKVFGLVLVTIVLVVAAFTAVILNQSGRLTGIVRKTSQSQQRSITEISEATMAAVLDTNMAQSTQMQAAMAQDLFGDAISVVNVIGDYTGKLFADPDAYPVREVEWPDAAKTGQITAQLLTEEGVDVSDPDVSAQLGLIGNLIDLMLAVYANSNVDSCYVALPSGVMLLVDNHSASKFDDEGNLVPIPIRERPWYVGAEQHGLYFTDVTSDLFTGSTSIMCAIPIYVSGELVAVIGADLFLNDISQAINNTARAGSFVCIINQYGHVLFSPETEGVFRVVPAEEARDLRVAEDPDLARFITDALASNTDLRLIEVDEELCYVAGAVISNVGWA
ncbi:MAG: cache domain-containing protein, partial [Clostridia bacterium]|nr:cache domain-containing protein [Clostridia bacterium]